MDHSCDSFVINIMPPADTFPAIRILRRNRNRPPSRLAAGEEIGFLGNQDSYNNANYDETAKEIGRCILENSDIITEWRNNQGYITE